MSTPPQSPNHEEQPLAADAEAPSKTASPSTGGEQSEGSEAQLSPPAEATQWQAIWAPQYNAYYFFNAVTQETTWVNPLQSEASSSSAAAAPEAPSAALEEAEEGEEDAEAGPSTGPQLSRVAAQHAAMQAAALAQGIDPLLAHLDPTLMQSTIPGSSGPSDLPTFTAKFNARTGQFAPMSSRTPGHLSEFERAKRMSEFYFDVGKWEEDLAKRGGRNMGEEDGVDETGKKRKRPSKKDIERFKEQKRLKKIAKTAWLRT
ncbi:hypothetical protein HYPSUDRAFT_65301 [Hypholoma sublateritium FD-334 SS-4]|uniref:WW domain-containing protein n=1 Tax=Hypholoma sublateritium (strain FD-334 SS-4) TaxID=945553 RepID=A0A0D2PZF2_HYPSF|nr:hypothetical protein HYPSUDRAFT_65301 [Hypholoma sublateritium FD-334 SS-4]